MITAWFVKTSGPEMLEHFVAGRAKDVSEQMRQYDLFEINKQKNLEKIRSDPNLGADDEINKFMEERNRAPTEVELQKYHMMLKEDKFHIYWMTPPIAKNYTLGGYTSGPERVDKAREQFLLNFPIIECNPVIVMEFDKESKWGRVIVVEYKERADKVTIKLWNKKPNEHFKKTVKRVADEIGLPVHRALHYMRRKTAIRWEHEVIYDTNDDN